MIPKYRMWNEIISKLCSVDGLYFDREVAQYKDEVGVSRFIKFENTILMQSTGLFDKSGQEFFEGDITASGNYPIKGVVEFRTDLGMWVNCLKRYDYYEYLGNVASGIEIIGNIYENPELLEADHDRD